MVGRIVGNWWYGEVSGVEVEEDKEIQLWFEQNNYSRLSLVQSQLGTIWFWRTGSKTELWEKGRLNQFGKEVTLKDLFRLI